MTTRWITSGRRFATIATALAAASILTLGACTASSDPVQQPLEVSSSSGSGGTVPPGSVSDDAHLPSGAAGPGDGTSPASVAATAGPTVPEGDSAADDISSGPRPRVTSGDVVTTTGTDRPDGVLTTTSPAPELDGTTAAWMAALCTAAGDAVEVSIPRYPYQPDTSPAAIQDIRRQALADYATLHGAFTRAADALAPLPPPTVDGGQRAADDAVASLRAMAEVAADAPAVLGAAATAADLESAMGALSDRMDDAADIVGDDSPLLHLGELMVQVPQCQALVTSSDVPAGP